MDREPPGLHPAVQKVMHQLPADLRSLLGETGDACLCSGCGAASMGGKFCGQCGHELAAEQADPEPEPEADPPTQRLVFADVSKIPEGRLTYKKFQRMRSSFIVERTDKEPGLYTVEWGMAKLSRLGKRIPMSQVIFDDIETVRALRLLINVILVLEPDVFAPAERLGLEPVLWAGDPAWMGEAMEALGEPSDGIIAATERIFGRPLHTGAGSMYLPHSFTLAMISGVEKAIRYAAERWDDGLHIPLLDTLCEEWEAHYRFKVAAVSKDQILVVWRNGVI